MSLMDKILTLNTTRPTESELAEPRTYRRRATWIPVEGEKVTVWRMQSFDPDTQQAYPGVFVAATDEAYTVLVEGEDTPDTFDKRDLHGARNWFLDHRGSHELEMNK
jgi:hypothetical protein